MKVTVKDIENSQKELSFEIPYETFVKSSDEELTKVIPDAKVPGFRSGKAPKDMIRKQYANKIRANAIERVISNAMSESFVSNNINPLSQPAISDMVFEDEKPISFIARVDVFPKIEITKFADYTIEQLRSTTTDHDIDVSLEDMRNRQSTFEPVTDRKDVRSGDVAVIDFIGRIDGEIFNGGQGSAYSLNVGSGQFIPGFEDQVIAMNVGDTKEVKVAFPKEYHVEDLKGKEAVFTVTVHEIKAKVAPKIDDEFAKDIDPKCSNLDELKAKIRKALVAESNTSSRYDTFTKMLIEITKDNPFDVPYSFVKEQADRLAYNSMSQFYSMGLDPEKVGINFDMMIERHIPQARDQVKHALIINELAKKNGIAVADDDIEKFLAHHADLQDRPATDIKAELETNNQFEAIKNDILSDKVYDFLASVNKLTLKEVSRDEYEKVKHANIDKDKETDTSDTKEKKVKKEKKSKNEAE